MLQIRKYTIKSEDDTYIKAIDKNNNKLLAIFSKYDKLNIDIMKFYLKIINDLDYNHVIIIYKNGITASAKKIIKNLFNIRIEYFSKDILQFDITEHRLVSPHIKIEGKEEEIIRKKYGDKLSIILLTDPQVKFHGFCKNDIIRIERNNGTIFYRIVK